MGVTNQIILGGPNLLAMLPRAKKGHTIFRDPRRKHGQFWERGNPILRQTRNTNIYPRNWRLYEIISHISQFNRTINWRLYSVLSHYISGVYN